MLGMRSLRRDDPDRYALTVLNQVLGGGMSSRLFQEVREQRGLAYSVYSYRAAFEETGALAIYAGTAPERVDELLQVLDDQLDRLVDGPAASPSASSWRPRAISTGSLSLSLESSSSRMHRLGRSELTMDEIPTLDELVAEIDEVTPDDIARVVDRVVAAARADGGRRRAGDGASPSPTSPSGTPRLRVSPRFATASARTAPVAFTRDPSGGVRRRRAHGCDGVRGGGR